MKQTAEKRGSTKKIVIAAVLVAAAALILGMIYMRFSPKAAAGDKQLVIEVVDDQGETTGYEIRTDAEYLREALEETEGLSVEGTESDYGLMVETVNGLTADYAADGAYWAFYVDGEYCTYGVDTQPVEDGQTYRIVYATE